MTYCVAAMFDAGIVMASDSRTNAGVDNVATFRKMKIYETPGERVIGIVNSGNLAVTQATLNKLDEAVRRRLDINVLTVPSMYEVAELIGAALRDVRHRDGPYLMQSNVDAGASFIVGGQIAGEPQRLFMVYAEGNFIEATEETPYFQIGETKYGKPIIDRVITPSIDMDDAVKCVLVSFDSTMRSNLSVGPPFDMLCYARDMLHVMHLRRFDENDTYLRTIRKHWSEGVRRAFAELPQPDWMDASDGT